MERGLMQETPIIDAARLEGMLDAPDVVLVDVRPPQLYARGHVPGAVNLPMFVLGSSQSGVPAADALARALGTVGISTDKHIVVYDDGGSPAAARLFWMLSFYRHARVSVLDGGIRTWAGRGYALDVVRPQVYAAQYAIAPADTSLGISTDELLGSLDDAGLVVLDARTTSEYHGLEITAARNGHIPGAVNIEWSESLEMGEDGIQLRSSSDLLRMFGDTGVTPAQRVVVHCQSGHRASHSFLTLKHLGYPNVSHYAAGWQEWGNRPDTPVVSE
jgi:thiosulfate/3-mercaptopyruvate sulfurtransferase